MLAEPPPRGKPLFGMHSLSCLTFIKACSSAVRHYQLCSWNRLPVQDIMASRETWKFMVMCLITVNLKQIFRHVDATLPKYLIRAYGCNAPVGLIYGINPGKHLSPPPPFAEWRPSKETREFAIRMKHRARVVPCVLNEAQ